MFRHGSKVSIVPIAAALAILTGCARGEAVAPDGAAADFAVAAADFAAAADSAALQDHSPGMAHADALAAHLDLGPAEEGRIRALLDSLHTGMMLAAQEGPDALVTAAKGAHARLEAALPQDARAALQDRMRHHNSEHQDHAAGMTEGLAHHEHKQQGHMGGHPAGHAAPGGARPAARH